MMETGVRRSWLGAALALVRLGLGVMVLGPAASLSEPLRWRWSHPQPHGNNVVDMAWSVTDAYWLQVAEKGTLYSSRDGFSWIPRESGSRMALRGVTFLGSRAVVTGESGTVLYADDPADFRPGELTDGPTADWLEGVAASSTLAVAVGDNGAIYTSTNAISWIRVDSTVDAWLRGVAHGGGVFVAVGESGTILVSADGAIWNKRTSPSSAHLNRVTHTSGGFVAVGDGGVVLTSALGNSWTVVSSGATEDLYTVAANTLDLLVAGDFEVRIRSGSGWTNELGREDGPLPATYLAGVGDSGSFFLAGRTGMMAEGFRVGAPPYQWFPRSSPLRPVLFDGSWVSNLFVAVGDRSTIMTSVDGVLWSYEFPPATYTNSVFLGVGGTTNLLVGAGNGGALMISPAGLTNVLTTNDLGLVVTQAVNTLGVVWHAVEPAPASEDLQGVCHWNGRYYVTGNEGLILSSADGEDWAVSRAPTTSFLSSVTGFPGGMVATGNRGALVRSPDGDTWSVIPPVSTNWIYRVRWLNDGLVAVGQNGTILMSDDGLDWTSRDSGTSTWLTDALWLAGRYYAVGLAGTVLTSTNGLEWADEGTITLKTLYGALTDHERLVVIGDEGVILRTQILTGTTPVDFLAYSREPSSDGSRWENLFLLSGRTDQQFALEFAQDLGDEKLSWSSGPWLEFLDASGTLLYWDSTAVEDALPEELYRAKSPP